MKLKFFIVTIFIMFGIGSIFSQNKKEVKNDKAKVVFDVSMTCENCKKRIEKNIAFERGVTDMKIDLEKKTVEIEYKKSQTTEEKLKEALKKLGYEVKIHKEEPDKDKKQKE